MHAAWQFYSLNKSKGLGLPCQVPGRARRSIIERQIEGAAFETLQFLWDRRLRLLLRSRHTESFRAVTMVRSPLPS